MCPPGQEPSPSKTSERASAGDFWSSEISRPSVRVRQQPAATQQRSILLGFPFHGYFCFCAIGGWVDGWMDGWMCGCCCRRRRWWCVPRRCSGGHAHLRATISCDAAMLHRPACPPACLMRVIKTMAGGWPCTGGVCVCAVVYCVGGLSGCASWMAPPIIHPPSERGCEKYKKVLVSSSSAPAGGRIHPPHHTHSHPHTHTHPSIHPGRQAGPLKRASAGCRMPTHLQGEQNGKRLAAKAGGRGAMRWMDGWPGRGAKQDQPAGGTGRREEPPPPTSLPFVPAARRRRPCDRWWWTSPPPAPHQSSICSVIVELRQTSLGPTHAVCREPAFTYSYRLP